MEQIKMDVQKYLATISSIMMNNSHSTSRVVECTHCNDIGYIYNAETNSCRECTYCNKLENERQATRIIRSNIPEKYKDARFDNFKTDIYPEPTMVIAQTVLTQCENYVKHFERIKTMEGCTGLYLFSEIKGSGKTRMACSIANELLEKHISVHYCTSIELLSRIRFTFNAHSKDIDVDSFINVMNYLENVPVLIIDDIGAEKQTDWVMEKLFEIIDTRVNRKGITIYTSNYPIDKLPVGTRLISRIAESSTRLRFPDVSIRNAIATNRNKEMQKFLLNPNG